MSFLFQAEYYSTGAKLFFRPPTRTQSHAQVNGYGHRYTLKCSPSAGGRRGRPAPGETPERTVSPALMALRGARDFGVPRSAQASQRLRPSHSRPARPRLSSQAPVRSRGGARTGWEGGRRGGPRPGVPSLWPPERLLCASLCSLRARIPPPSVIPTPS